MTPYDKRAILVIQEDLIKIFSKLKIERSR